MILIQKNIIYCTIEAIFSFYNGYSGRLFFGSVFYLLFELFLTNFNTALYFILNTDLNINQILDNPICYLAAPLLKLISIPILLEKIGVAIL